MGGGTSDSSVLKRFQRLGLSPRGRGNRRHSSKLGRHPQRSIPAWAGEPRSEGRRLPFCRWLRSIPAWAGEPWALPASSEGCQRSIPAWAGEPAYDAACGPKGEQGLSPRGRGNLTTATVTIPATLGVYPRVGGGTNQCARMIHALVHGLSPRGRGTRFYGRD